MPCRRDARLIDRRGASAPVEIPHAPTPTREPIPGLAKADVHLSASPTGMRAKEPAGLPAGNRANAFGIAVEQGGEIVGRLDHQPARAAVQADRMSLVGDPLHDVSRFVGDVLIDEKERRARIGRRQCIEQRRRPIRIRSVVKGQVDRGRARVAQASARAIASAGTPRAGMGLAPCVPAQRWRGRARKARSRLDSRGWLVDVAPNHGLRNRRGHTRA